MPIARWAVVVAMLVGSSGCAPTVPAIITHRRSGATTTLNGLRGKVLVVNFWAEWCKPCIQEVPDIARVADALGPDVLFLPVYHHVDPGPGPLAAWIEAQPAYFRERVCFASSSFLSRYDLSRIPHTYVYGKDGAQVADFLGAVSGTRLDELRAALQRALR